jgi:hypothetical protein
MKIWRSLARTSVAERSSTTSFAQPLGCCGTATAPPVRTKPYHRTDVLCHKTKLHNVLVSAKPNHAGGCKAALFGRKRVESLSRRKAGPESRLSLAPCRPSLPVLFINETTGQCINQLHKTI